MQKAAFLFSMAEARQAASPDDEGYLGTDPDTDDTVSRDGDGAEDWAQGQAR